jgi:hypothetical protein
MKGRVRPGGFQRFFATAIVAALACFPTTRCGASDAGEAKTSEVGALERQAEQFVTLALSLGRLHPEEIDAYFGPPRLDVRSAATGLNLETIRRKAQTLLAGIEASTDGSPRKRKLQRQVQAFGGLLDILNKPGARTFDAEALLVYGMEPPPHGSEKAAHVLHALEALLPGPGSLTSRVANFRHQFVVSTDRRKAVFERALRECRARTLAKWRLPAGEQLNVEWTRKVDAAWHRYEGNGRSTLQLNPAAVAYVGSAVDVACHEGYPGHHAQFVVMEAHAGARGLAVEDAVVLLRSPISMLREGAANYGVDLAFAAGERFAFERDVLFPLAGLDPARARQYREVHRLVDELSSNVVPIVRDYRDKRLSPALARRALEASALVSSPESLLRFVDQLGPYVLGYTAARDRVRGHVAQSGQDRWTALRTVLEQGNVSAFAP